MPGAKEPNRPPPPPGRSFPLGALPPELRDRLSVFFNLNTEDEVLRAIGRAGLVMVSRPPQVEKPIEMSAEEREHFKRSWGLDTDEEVNEALEMHGLVSVGLNDLSGVAKTARHPLLVVKAIRSGMGVLEAQLREVVPVLRERGISWTQIGHALGITKQSAWERFSGED